MPWRLSGCYSATSIRSEQRYSLREKPAATRTSTQSRKGSAGSFRAATPQRRSSMSSREYSMAWRMMSGRRAVRSLVLMAAQGEIALARSGIGSLLRCCPHKMWCGLGSGAHPLDQDRHRQPDHHPHQQQHHPQQQDGAAQGAPPCAYPAQISASCNCNPGKSGVASSTSICSRRCGAPLAGHTSTAC